MWSVLHLVGAALFVVLMLARAVSAGAPPAPLVIAIGASGPAVMVASRIPTPEFRNAGCVAGRNAPDTGGILFQ
jgi:hypothetical protein